MKLGIHKNYFIFCDFCIYVVKIENQLEENAINYYLFNRIDSTLYIHSVVAISVRTVDKLRLHFQQPNIWRANIDCHRLLQSVTSVT